MVRLHWRGTGRGIGADVAPIRPPYRPIVDVPRLPLLRYCTNVGKRVLVAAALVGCLFILAGCGFGSGPRGLPDVPDDTARPAAVGDIGYQPPTTPQPPYGPGPARIDVKQFHFHEAGQETEVDLEFSGTHPDLSYNHFSGEFRPIYGAGVFLYDKDDVGPDKPTKRSDYPGEQECRNNRDKDNLIREWQGAFSKDDLEGNKFSIFCIKTVEGHVGLLFIEPDESKKPIAYEVYSHTWVR